MTLIIQLFLNAIINTVFYIIHNCLEMYYNYSVYILYVLLYVSTHELLISLWNIFYFVSGETRNNIVARLPFSRCVPCYGFCNGNTFDLNIKIQVKYFHILKLSITFCHVYWKIICTAFTENKLIAFIRLAWGNNMMVDNSEHLHCELLASIQWNCT